jgi:urease subunit gamma/beta
VRLTPAERDRLLLFTAAELARARRRRGLRLNVPEATALIADAVCEAARDGRSLAAAVAAGRSAVSSEEVLAGVADLLAEVQVEAVFEDGTRLVVVPEPVAGPRLGQDAPGAVIPRHQAPPVVPDQIQLQVTSTAQVPITITSHFHFFEVNRLLRFDRAAAYGRRLAIPAGATARFEPGATRLVALTPIGGTRTAIGFAGLVDGPLDAPGAKEAALRRARAHGYLDVAEAQEQAP